MSQGFGPYSVTAGTIQTVNVDPSTASLYIANDSPYDVFVSFNPTQPSPSSILNQDWIGVVQAFHHIVRPVPGGAQLVTPQGAQTFQGKVWLLPVNTRNTSLALNGTVSSTANLYVEAYLPGEAPPTAYASPRQTDITSQARVISVPITPVLAYSGQAALAVNARLQWTFNAGFNPALAGTAAANIYLYYLSATPSSATAWGAWALNVVWLNNTLSVISRNELYRFVLIGSIASTNGVYGSHVFTPAFPHNLAGIAIPAGAVAISGEWTLLSSASSANTAMYVAAGIGIDSTTNGTLVPDIGNASTPFIASQGIIF